jgi:hypothetical protein
MAAITATMPIVTMSSTSVNPRFVHGGFAACFSLEIDKYPPFSDKQPIQTNRILLLSANRGTILRSFGCGNARRSVCGCRGTRL